MSDALILRGLRAVNPLGFLAALGTLRVSATVWTPERVRMRWVDEGEGWVPALRTPAGDAPDALVAALDQHLRLGARRAVLGIGKNLNLDGAAYRALADQWTVTARPFASDDLEMLAGFGTDRLAGNEKDEMASTPLCTLRGAGHQHFLPTASDLVAQATPAHVHEALFGPWRYADEKLGLRIDPAEFRPRALRWRDPSKDTARTVRGANRLAIEGFALLPVMPAGRDARTVGFSSSRGQRATFSWPVWEHWASIDVVRSLLMLRGLHADAPPHDELQSLGVVQVFRAQRFMDGKFANFGSAIAV